MNSYGKNSYNRRYDNDNKYESSSLSNVYRDLMSSNKETPMISQYDSKKYPDYNFQKNYHFQNSNRSSHYKSMSPPIHNSQNYNNFSSNVSKNFFSNYDQDRNNNDFLYQRGHNRIKSFDSNQNINRNNNNIFSYNNYNNSNISNNINNNNNNSFNKRNFYDTITNFGKDTYNKMNNNLYNNNNEKDNYRRNNSNYSTSTYKPDLVYRNYFNENNNNNNKVSNNSSNKSFYSKSPENHNLKSYDSKYSFFTSKNNFNNLNYSSIKSSDFENSNYRLYKGYSQDNIHNRNNSYSYNNKKYKIANYSSSTMAGTNGFGITKTNQDSYLIKIDKNNKDENEYTFGVFDGHGAEGHLVSQAIKQFFTNCSYFDFNAKSLILEIFSSLSRIINNSQYFDSIGSGSTVVLVHINSEKIICINCGDSRAILITKNKNIIPLSRDHKPELPEEKKRIEENGGRVDKIFGMGPFRVWFRDEDYPGLAMSRSIGDKLAHKVGVSDIPEIKEFNIYDLDPLAIIVASDGIWEFMSNDEVKNIVLNYAYNKDANNCAKNLVEKARITWKETGYAIDDITCVVAFFSD